MLDKDKLAELLTRTREATGPDRLLDHDILLAVGWTAPLIYHHRRKKGGAWVNDWEGSGYFAPFDPETESGAFWRTPDGEWGKPELPRLTGSLDAALTLVERLLPNHRWGVHCHHSSRGEYRAHVTKQSPLRPMPNIADGQTPALTILAAFLEALSHKEHD